MAGIAGMVSPTDDILQKIYVLCPRPFVPGEQWADIIPHRMLCFKTNKPIGQTSKGSFVSEVVFEGKTYILALDGIIFNRNEISSDLNF